METIKNMLGKVGSRKLAVTILVLLCGTLVDLFSKNGLSVNLSNLMMALAGVFAVGNGMEHIAKKGENKPSNNKIDLSPIQSKIDDTNKSLTTVLNTLSFIIDATGLNRPRPVVNTAAPIQQGAVNRQQAAVNRQIAEEILNEDAGDNS